MSLRAHRTLALVALCLSLLLTSSCGETIEEIVYKDYPVEFDQKDELDEIVGDPELVLGVFDEQLFNDLSQGDEVAIINGFQGGTWVHISVRAFGVRSDGEVSAELGDGIGQIRYPLKLTRSPEGFLEAYDIPIPVNPADGDIDALFGQQVELHVSFTTSEMTIEETLEVVLVSGS